MSTEWQGRAEAGSGWLVRFIRWVAVDVSEPLARGMLYPIAAYFFLVRDVERNASRRYLRRVLGREPRMREVFHHIRIFARSILDRVSFLSGRRTSGVRVHGAEHMRALIEQRRGVILLGSHLGSFEAVRAVGFAHDELEVRILMDYAQNAQVTALLDALNPRAGASVIDAREESTRVLLQIHETLSRGGLVGILADRPHTGEATVTVPLLDGEAGLPLGPFRIAAVTQAPVVLIFGLLREDGSYDVYFEPFAERIVIRRGQREADAARWVEQYARRLEARIREAPYNWFNFYDYWIS